MDIMFYIKKYRFIKYKGQRIMMEYNKLDKRIQIAWRISRIIGIVITGVVFGAALFFLARIAFIKPYLHYICIGMGIIVAYMLAALIIYPVIEYKQWGYIITDDRVEIRHGIFFVKNTIIPIIRIQHITVSQGPIIRKLGISIVNIHTASGLFVIAGISNEEAGLIAEGLKSKLYTRLEAQDK
ncbi:MAG: Bacterial rane flanked domain family [Clostridiaceae bacterium]|jgi:membrane protein YdbS with pleckstrin-like domain|nr:Bacterial rane flanked domain family [Clostridiaceae bacterium]